MGDVQGQRLTSGSPMTPWLRYISLLTPDVDRTAAFYVDNLDMRPVPVDADDRNVDSGGGPRLVLVDASGGYGLQLSLTGPPFMGWQESFFASQGYGIDHLGYGVPALEPYADRLARLEIRPVAGAPLGSLAFHDPAGRRVALAKVPSEERPAPNLPIRSGLHHAGGVAPDLAGLARFYRDALDLHAAYSHGQDGGGFIFMADQGVIADQRREGPIMELVGPPGLWEMETEFLTRQGPGWYHICFAVADVDGTHARLLAAGLPFDIAPMDDDKNRLAFLRDPDMQIVELMLPVRRVHGPYGGGE